MAPLLAWRLFYAYYSYSRQVWGCLPKVRTPVPAGPVIFRMKDKSFLEIFTKTVISVYTTYHMTEYLIIGNYRFMKLRNWNLNCREFNVKQQQRKLTRRSQLRNQTCWDKRNKVNNLQSVIETLFLVLSPNVGRESSKEIWSLRGICFTISPILTGVHPHKIPLFPKCQECQM